MYMYNCNFTYHDWFGPILVHAILKKLECYVISSASTDDRCSATAIKECCAERDTCTIIL